MSDGRQIPMNELDFQFMGLEPGWQVMNDGLKVQLGKVEKIYEQDGKAYKEVDDLADVMSAYTRDIRLSNLDFRDLPIVRDAMRLGVDCLSIGLKESAVACLNVSASFTEPSQGKKGFLRKLMVTVRSMQWKEESRPKKGLFGGKKEQGE